MIIEYFKKDSILKTKNHPKESIQILQEWLKSIIHNPYPSSSEKKELAKRSNLEEKQVSLWFQNTRARKTEKVEVHRLKDQMMSN